MTRVVIEKIHMTFSELRFLSTSVIQMLSKESGVSTDKISLNTAVNNDFGIQGDDWDTILQRLQEDFDCELDGLNFYDYFIDEVQIANRLPAHLLYLPIQCLLFLLIYPFNRAKASVFWNRELFKTHPDLTVADLITSIVKKKWAPRCKVNFELIKMLK